METVGRGSILAEGWVVSQLIGRLVRSMVCCSWCSCSGSSTIWHDRNHMSIVVAFFGMSGVAVVVVVRGGVVLE